MSFRHGEFEGERKGRYFTDMTEDKLDRLLKPLTSWSLNVTDITFDVRPGRSDERWLNMFYLRQ